eukprot:2593399-Amphidinium_carterae.1
MSLIGPLSKKNFELGVPQTYSFTPHPNTTKQHADLRDTSKSYVDRDSHQDKDALKAAQAQLSSIGWDFQSNSCKQTGERLPEDATAKVKDMGRK